MLKLHKFDREFYNDGVIISSRCGKTCGGVGVEEGYSTRVQRDMGGGVVLLHTNKVSIRTLQYIPL